MKATLKTAQMGLAVGAVVEVVNRGVRACVVQGAAKEVSVTVPTEDLVFEEPFAPEPPAEPHFSTAPSDLDEPAFDPEDKSLLVNTLAEPKPKKKVAKKKVVKDDDA